jgi:hypothetical protein
VRSFDGSPRDALNQSQAQSVGSNASLVFSFAKDKSRFSNTYCENIFIQAIFMNGCSFSRNSSLIGALFAQHARLKRQCDGLTYTPPSEFAGLAIA